MPFLYLLTRSTIHQLTPPQDNLGLSASNRRGRFDEDRTHTALSGKAHMEGNADFFTDLLNEGVRTLSAGYTLFLLFDQRFIADSFPFIATYYAGEPFREERGLRGCRKRRRLSWQGLKCVLRVGEWDKPRGMRPAG